MPNYDINYEDERFKNVETEKQTQLNQANEMYNNMINQSDKFYQDQINASKNYADKQTQIQNDNTQFAIDKINQQKEQAQKDYTKEQSGAYVDWRQQSNNYGANAEEMAANGLQNTGYSESSQVSMYNTYQNRVATARQSFEQSKLNYDNAIKEAQLANNSALADIAYKALQSQLELSLQGFQYKNTLFESQLQQQQNIEDRGYSKWKDVLNQINSENELKENMRQYQQNFDENKRQYETTLAENKRQHDLEMQYQRERDAIKDRQYQEQLAYQKERDRVADEQWKKQYDLSVSSRNSSSSYSYSSGSSSSYSNGLVPYGELSNSYGDGKGNIIYVDNNGNQYKMKENYNPYTGTKNSDAKNGTFSNGYQPNNVSGKSLHKSGKTGTINGQTQNIWKCDDGKYYYWDGTQNKYFKLNNAEKKAFGL